MNMLRKNKIVAGNIALVLFFFFLVSVGFGGSAAASVIQLPIPTGSEATISFPHNTTTSISGVQIFPVTQDEFNSIVMTIYQGLAAEGNILGTVYAISDGVYAQVYNNILGYVYAMVYNFVSPYITVNSSNSYTIVYNINDTVKSIYLTLEAPPPQPPYVPPPP
ncbi:MAG: hypothetical protein KGZ96_07510, partial [Clostridia bacterium]|nr:hypothetical protein [Clostridia bacterium]